MKLQKFARIGKSVFKVSKKGKLKLLMAYSSINQAKRKSAKLQMATDGGLGRGCLSVGGIR